MRELSKQELEHVGGGLFLLKRLIAKKVAVVKAKKSPPAKGNPKGHDDDC